MCPLGAALRNTDKQNQMETLSGNVFSPAAAAPFGKLLLKELTICGIKQAHHYSCQRD